MISPDMAESTNASHACFLCTLDTQPCAVKQLEGQVIYAHEFTTQGEITPYITLDLGATYASLQLTHTYRSLVKGLQELAHKQTDHARLSPAAPYGYNRTQGPHR